MDAYFASVEEISKPYLVNKPFIVSQLTKRAIVSTANYVARKYGIKSAMPTYKAKQLCEELIIVNPNYCLYEYYHDDIINFIKAKYTNNIEVVSIDECYIDVTDLVHSKTEAYNLAKKIQNDIKTNIKLSCSIGISTTKFLAKMASKLQKPFGISTLYKNEVKDKIFSLPVGELFLLGKSTAAMLKNNNILYIKDIVEGDKKKLKSLLSNYNYFIDNLNAKGENALTYEESPAKSISNAYTFLNDTNDIDEIKSVIKYECRKIVSRMNETEKFKTISIRIKMDKERSYTRSITITPTNSFDELFANALFLFQNNFENKLIRLIGVAVSNFC
ncbi:MAG: DNA polymerase IV [Mycoplasmataceae bacterium]|nr:DNA polymerase IV [Mycoplasmataceae bacterium]